MAVFHVFLEGESVFENNDISGRTWNPLTSAFVGMSLRVEVGVCQRPDRGFIATIFRRLEFSQYTRK